MSERITNENIHAKMYMKKGSRHRFRTNMG